MSRSQQTQVLNTATANSGADQTAATKAATAETGAIGDYSAQLAKYAAENPFTPGGEYQTSQNQTLAGTADAGSAAITNQENTIAQRTGQNAASADAVAAEAARANQRDLSSAEGAANDKRIGSEADYNKGVVGMSEVPAQLDAGMYATSLGGANSSLNTAESAAQTPSFWDTLGSSFATQLGKTAGGGNLSLTKAL